MTVLGVVITCVLVWMAVFRAVRVKKNSDATDWYIAELRKAKARRTTMNLGEAQWLTRVR